MILLKYITDVPAGEWLTFILFFTAIVLFIGLAEFLRKSVGWNQEINRKLVHILTGVLVFFSPLFFKYSAPLIILGIIFTIVNTLGLITNSLKGMQNSDRKTYGTIFFPIVFILLVIACWPNHKIIIMASILILGISDAMAAIVGESVKNPHMFNLIGEKKSVEGSAAMFISTFLVILIILPMFDYIDNISITFTTALWIASLCGIFAASIETLSIVGSDNLTVPLGSAFVIGFMLNSSFGENILLTAGAVLALSIAYFSYKIKALNKSGSVATFVLGFIIFGIGGYQWSLPILIFFILSTILSKIEKAKKAQFSLMFEKSDTRDASQVVANGGIAGVIILLNLYFPSNLWFYLYLGALAAVNSDTWATELGVLSPKNPVSLKNFKRTEKGQSGSISFTGTLSALLGSAVIVISGIIAAPDLFPPDARVKLILALTLAGFLGSFIDSVIGAFFQVQYKCIKCGKITERKIHCNSSVAEYFTGNKWITNDLVNLFCSFSGSAMAFFLIKPMI